MVSDSFGAGIVLSVFVATAIIAVVALYVCIMGAYNLFIEGSFISAGFAAFAALLVSALIGGTVLEFIAPLM